MTKEEGKLVDNKDRIFKDIDARLSKIRDTMEERGLDALLIADRYCIRYVTNYSTSALPSFLVLPKEGEMTLLSDMFYPCFANPAKFFTYTQDLRHSGYSISERVAEVLKGLKIDRGKLGTVGFTSGFDPMTWTLYSGLQNVLKGASLQDAEDIFLSLKLIKSDLEIEFLRKAADIAQKQWEKLQEIAREGVWQQDIVAEIDKVALEWGAEFQPTPLGTFLACGPMAEQGLWVAIAKPVVRKLERGDQIIFGASLHYEGYHGHLFRTAVIGKPNEKQQRIFDIVLGVYDSGIKMPKPGLVFGNFLKHSVAMFSKVGYGEEATPGAGYGKYMLFPGGQAHGIGLTMLEPPSKFTPDLILRPGMAFTYHPNLTVPGEGVAVLGDMCLVTETDVEILSKRTQQRAIACL